MFSGLFQNKPTNLTKSGDLEKKIDSIFTDFLLKQSFEDYSKSLSSTEYEESIYTTEEVLLKALSNVKDKSLDNIKNNSKEKSKKLVKISKKNLLNNLERKEKIEHISDFYYKLYEIYNSIVTALNPLYSYMNDNGEEVFFRLSDYKEHLTKIKDKTVKLKKEFTTGSIINNRLKLLYEAFKNDGTPKLDIEFLCSIDIDDNKKMPDLLSQLKGIQELEKLFYLDKNSPDKMDTKSRLLFEERLNYFYKLYTGNPNPRPDHIDTFDKVTLLRFDLKSKYCREPSKTKMKTLPKMEEKFYRAFTKNLLAMNRSVEKRKKNLLKILNYIFIRNSDGTMIINPKINNDEKLLKLVFSTIDNITKLYINVQKFFLQGLYIFDKMYKSHEKKIKILKNKNINTLIKNDKIITAPRVTIDNSKVKQNISEVLATKRRNKSSVPVPSVLQRQNASTLTNAGTQNDTTSTHETIKTYTAAAAPPPPPTTGAATEAATATAAPPPPRPPATEAATEAATATAAPTTTEAATAAAAPTTTGAATAAAAAAAAPPPPPTTGAATEAATAAVEAGVEDAAKAEAAKADAAKAEAAKAEAAKAEAEKAEAAKAEAEKAEATTAATAAATAEEKTGTTAAAPELAEASEVAEAAKAAEEKSKKIENYIKTMNEIKNQYNELENFVNNNLEKININNNKEIKENIKSINETIKSVFLSISEIHNNELRAQRGMISRAAIDRLTYLYTVIEKQSERIFKKLQQIKILIKNKNTKTEIESKIETEIEKKIPKIKEKLKKSETYLTLAQ